MKIKIVELKSLIIPDSWLFKEWNSFDLFIKTYKIDKKHHYYYYHDGMIYAFFDDSHSVDYVKVPDYIELERF